MKHILKTYLKPVFNRMGIYPYAHKFYFFVLRVKTVCVNLCYKLIKKHATILLYHRVGTVKNDPVMLCVSPEVFEQHLLFLQRFYSIVSLREISDRLVSGTLQGNEAAITFDDGYQDNLLEALPILEKYKAPATIFVTTKFIGEVASFEWDMKYSLEDRASVLNREEIRTLSQHPLIDIGAHTHTHPRLSDLTEEEQLKEIKLSKKILEDITGKPVTLFAYPFGGLYEFNSISKKIVKDLGFEYGYSNTQVLATKKSDRYAIDRINMREYSESQLARQLMLVHFFVSNIKDVLVEVKTTLLTLYWKWRFSRVKKINNLCHIDPCYLIRDILNSKSVVVDVGTGYSADFSLSLIKKYPGLKSFGIDPTQKHQVGLTNISNQEKNFSYTQKALYTKNTTISFYESDHRESGSLFEKHYNIKKYPSHEYLVETVTLSELLSLTQSDYIDILKMDIEGAEYDILAHASSEVLENVGQIIVEFHHKTVGIYTKKDTRKIRKKLTSIGFTEYTEDGINYLFFR